MSCPVVSVCVATYNQDKYIKNCIVSVLSQIPDVSIEILIGNDGNGPETPKIIANLAEIYPGKIRYFKHIKNLGPSANYQFLIREACGTYIAHLDGDDFWLPGKLAAQIAWLQTHPESIACYTNAVVISDTQELSGGFNSPILEPIDLSFILRKGNFLNHSSILYRASRKNIILNFDGPFIDYKIHLNFAQLGILGFINAVFVVYRLNSMHSMVKTTPNLVLNLYFEALSSVINKQVITESDRRHALRNFWQTIVMDGIVKNRLSFIISWFRMIRLICPGSGNFSVFFLGLFLAIFGILNLFFKRVIAKFNGVNNLKVLHER